MVELAGYSAYGNTQTFVFAEVKRTPRKRGKCGCGKRRERVGHFSQTINPYNVHKRGVKKGQPKDRADILKELDREVKAWMKEPITCKNCEKKIINGLSLV